MNYYVDDDDEERSREYRRRRRPIPEEINLPVDFANKSLQKSFSEVILESRQNVMVYSWGHIDVTNSASIFDRNVLQELEISTKRKIRHMCASPSHCLLLTVSGEVYGFGNNREKEIVPESDAEYLARPVLIECLTQNKITSIACGLAHTACVTSHGTVITFGGNELGQLGHSDVGTSIFPPRMMLGVQIRATKGPINLLAKRVACSDLATFVITTEGWLFSSGDDRCNGLKDLPAKEVLMGPNSPLARARWVETLSAVGIGDISCGSTHVVAISSSGTNCFSWGMNQHKQTGQSEEFVHLPQEVIDFDRDDLCDAIALSRNVGQELCFSSVACGLHHTLLVTKDGRLFGCGKNKQGEVGLDGLLICRFSEVPLMTTFDELMGIEDKLIQASVGASHSIVLSRCGVVYVTGSNMFGQIWPVWSDDGDVQEADGFKTFTRLLLPSPSSSSSSSQQPGTPEHNSSRSNNGSEDSKPSQGIERSPSLLLDMLTSVFSSSSSSSPAGNSSPLPRQNSGRIASNQVLPSPSTSSSTDSNPFNRGGSAYQVSDNDAGYLRQALVLSTDSASTCKIIYVCASGNNTMLFSIPKESCSEAETKFSENDVCWRDDNGAPITKQFSIPYFPTSLSTRQLTSYIRDVGDNDQSADAFFKRIVFPMLSSPLLLSSSFITSNKKSVSHLDIESIEDAYEKLLTLPRKLNRYVPDTSTLGPLKALFGIASIMQEPTKITGSIVVEGLLTSFRDCLKSFKALNLSSLENVHDVVRVILIIWQCPLLLKAELTADLLITISELIMSLSDGRSVFLLKSLSHDYPMSVFRARLVNPIQIHLVYHLDVDKGRGTAVPLLCKIATVLYAVNNRRMQLKTGLDYSVFYSDYVSNTIRPDQLLTDLLHYRRAIAAKDNRAEYDRNFFLCKYPFLISAESKRIMIQGCASDEQQHAAVNSFANSLFNGGHVSPYLMLSVRREHLVNDTLNQLNAQQITSKATASLRSGNSDNSQFDAVGRHYLLPNSVSATFNRRSELELKKPLKIAFTGEEGIDAGGVKKEFFQIIMDRLFDVNYGMFVETGNKRHYWFNVACNWSINEYHLIGILFGLALYNDVVLDAKFPLVVYKKLLGGTSSIEITSKNIKPSPHEASNLVTKWMHCGKSFDLTDFAEIDAEMANGLQQLLDYEGRDLEEIYCRTFSVEWTEFGTSQVRPLIEGGESIPITQANKHEYVALYLDWILVKSISDQFNAFHSGFSRVMDDAELLYLLRPEELELLITGTPHLDFHKLEAAAEYEGYLAGSRAVKWFWESVHEFEFDVKRKMLTFVTGSAKAPIGGLGKLKIKIQRAGPDSDQLPTSHTCFNTLVLADYNTKERLKLKLRIAVQECQGFGLI